MVLGHAAAVVLAGQDPGQLHFACIAYTQTRYDDEPRQVPDTAVLDMNAAAQATRTSNNN